MTRKFLLEVCVGSLDDALAAKRGGAHRLELCGALELGGLTPSIGLVEQVVAQAGLPVVVMVRPRAGGFAYSPREFDTMLRDAERVLAAGAAGIVTGVLDDQSRVDERRMAQLVGLAGNRESVMHRAFDFVADPLAALDTLIACGVSRVLTSGQAPTAVEGAAVIGQLIERAAGRIEILPGGGVSAANVVQLVRGTDCRQVHIGATRAAADPSLDRNGARALCDLPRLSEGTYRQVDEALVRSVATPLTQFGP
jgi:copper homeostasis protein